jgi:hypothetical protein
MKTDPRGDVAIMVVQLDLLIAARMSHRLHVTGQNREPKPQTIPSPCDPSSLVGERRGGSLDRFPGKPAIQQRLGTGDGGFDGLVGLASKLPL